jgi:hypothetical protein
MAGPNRNGVYETPASLYFYTYKEESIMMKRMFWILMGGLVMASPVWAQIQTYTVNYTNAAITIDGVVSPGEYADAAPAAAGFRVLRTAPPGSLSPEGISFQAVYNDTDLFIVVTTNFPTLSGDFNFTDGALPTGDDLEIFIDPNMNGEANVPPPNNTDPRVEDSYQIIVSLAPGTQHRISGNAGPPGFTKLARYNALFGDNVTGGWNPTNIEFGIVSAVSTGAVAEFRIPFADLNAATADVAEANSLVVPGTPNQTNTWLFNVGRIASDSSLPIWQYHAGTANPATGAGAFFAEREYGEITFAPPSSVSIWPLY